MRLLPSTLSGTFALAAQILSVSGDLLGIPPVPFQSSSGVLRLIDLSNIVVDSAHQNVVNDAGQTLIPPTLEAFANTFASDLKSTIGVDLGVQTGSSASSKSIFLTIGNNSAFVDAAGRWTSEGYTLDVFADQITITGASPLGVWWGTRSVIQQAILNNKTIAQGNGNDAPSWEFRGMMLDAGRHWYPPEFITEMCSYMSFFKLNTFHLHVSDNLYAPPYAPWEYLEQNIYSAFRLLSTDPAVAGLNKRANESYDEATFMDMQEKCASRGVTILPEIESPGHALVINEWKPELALDTDPSLMNISHPDMIPTMKTIWSTFLPWMKSKTVHMGADEYSSEYRSDYVEFVNELGNYISAQGEYRQTRIWGTFPPVDGEANTYKNISIQHWEYFEDNPYTQYIQNGYEVVNSNDALYVVGGWSGSYPQALSEQVIWNGNPATGGPYAPYTFDNKMASNNPPRDSALVLGQLAAVWNDNGNPATSVVEAYYSIRNGLPGLSAAQWGNLITEQQFDGIFETLHQVIPGQNLDRSIPSKTPLIVDYSMAGSKGLKDASGNGYDASLQGDAILSGSSVSFQGRGSVKTPISSKGRNYTLAFSVKPTSSGGILFEGSDSILYNGIDGSSYVALLERATNIAYVIDYALPLNNWTSAALVASGRDTYLRVDSAGASTLYQFEASFPIIQNGGYIQTCAVGINAPIGQIGSGFTGEMKNIFLSTVPILSKTGSSSSCAALPAGIAHQTSPDTATAFVTDSYYSKKASQAGVPSGFHSVFQNLRATVSAPNYLGYTTLASYDVKQCAARCSANKKCSSFNVYFERDPMVSPNSDACGDPPSTTIIKCAWWGSEITTTQANNFGQTRNEFQVVIAGSNGYVVS